MEQGRLPPNIVLPNNLYIKFTHIYKYLGITITTGMKWRCGNPNQPSQVHIRSHETLPKQQRCRYKNEAQWPLFAI